jgi:hypothetical protein
MQYVMQSPVLKTKKRTIMVNISIRCNLKFKISMVSVSLLVTVLVGCAGVTIKDDLPPSIPKGYADFGNYSLGSTNIYSLRAGKRVKEGSLTYDGAILRIARAPGNYDFLIEHWGEYRQKDEKRVTVSITRDMLTFITIDDIIEDVVEIMRGRYESTRINYRIKVSEAKTSAPLNIESEPNKAAILNELLSDPDWRARLYAISLLEKMGSAGGENLLKRAEVLAADDPQRLVRRKASAFLKGLGIDAFKNILYLENFESNNRTWINSHGIYDYFYNDEFLFRSAKGGCENEKITSPLDLPRDFDIELVSTWRSGTDVGEYGVFIGSDENNFDHFGISGDGRAVVRSIRNNELAGDLLAWTAVPAIKTQGSAPNRLRVEVRGGTWKYYVNDAFVGTLANTMEINTYLVGLRDCLEQAVAFEQLKISRTREN